MASKVGINGFGRIGRNVLRASLKHGDIDFVPVNDITDTKTLAHLLEYDSVLGNLDPDMKVRDNPISVNSDEFQGFTERVPGKIQWASVGSEMVIEFTGLFTERDDATKHVHDTMKEVIIPAPAKGDISFRVTRKSCERGRTGLLVSRGEVAPRDMREESPHNSCAPGLTACGITRRPRDKMARLFVFVPILILILLLSSTALASANTDLSGKLDGADVILVRVTTLLILLLSALRLVWNDLEHLLRTVHPPRSPRSKHGPAESQRTPPRVGLLLAGGLGGITIGVLITLLFA